MRVIYYFLQFTWGLPINIFGFLAYVFLRIFGLNAKRHGFCRYLSFGENWGGFSLGMFFFCDFRESDRTKNHEFGHSIQNCIFGIFMIPLTLVSVCRYHYRGHKERIGKPCESQYDDFWFEGQATKLGNKYIDFFQKGDD